MRKFISIDGQHGVGKSHIVNKLCCELIQKGYVVVKTKEPTDSTIGLLARKSENNCIANSLVRLFAADRLAHCRQIQTWLDEDKIVISDRYIISGLILQNMDGVTFEDIKCENEGILVPDLSVVIYADQDIIDKRMSGKIMTRLARQERMERYDRYLANYELLLELYPNILFFRNNSEDDEKHIVKTIIDKIEE